jgi:hypothetical protein
VENNEKRVKKQYKNGEKMMTRNKKEGEITGKE